VTHPLNQLSVIDHDSGEVIEPALPSGSDARDRVESVVRVLVDLDTPQLA